MTPRQKQTLDFIARYKLLNGICPSYEEIRIGIGAKSRSQVLQFVRLLVEEGALRRIQKVNWKTKRVQYAYRGLEIVEPENYHASNCPYCGSRSAA